jgi:Phosphotransferase enzyme family
MAEAEVPGGTELPAGRMTSGIIRRGGRIWRPAGPWSPAVHEYLRHLEAAGFTGAPRVLGTEADREILSYLDGDVPADPQWQPGRGHRLPGYARSDAALAGAARLIRALHDAAAGFVPAGMSYRFHPHPPLPGEIVCHGDLGPWNTVYRDGVPAGFIDWDAAEPARPLTDLAAAAWGFVPLAPPGQLAEAGFDPGLDLSARLQLFARAYGLAEPQALVPELAAAKLAQARRISYWGLDAAGSAGALEFLAGELRWIHAISPALAAQCDRNSP